MRVSDKGIIALMIHECIVPAPYKDSVGVWTYGIGHTKAAGYPNPAEMPRGMPSNVDAALVQVFEVFRSDLPKYEEAVNKAITTEMTQAQFDAAVSFHYNTGGIGRASWVKKFNAGDFAGACAGIMAWKKPPSIIPRRQAEQNLFKNGVYPDGQITVWNVSPAGKVIWTPAMRLGTTDALSLLRGAMPHPEPTKAPSGLISALMAILAALFRRK